MELSEPPGRSTGSTARSTSGMSERWWSRAVLGNYLTPVSRLLPPHGHPSAGAGSVVLGGGARHVGGADAFEREAVARALIDDAAQLLGEGDPGVAAGERGQRGEPVGDVVGAGGQPGGGHHFVDRAPALGGLRVQRLSRQDAISSPAPAA